MYSNIVKKIWFGLAFLILFIIFHFVGVSYFTLLYGSMPSFDLLENPKSALASELYSADSCKVLGKYFRSNRSSIEFNDISPNMLHALVATEDVRYYHHSGIDFKGTFAIFFYMMLGSKRGSSTLSQQLAKNLFKTRDKSYAGLLGNIPIIKGGIIKTKEWLVAMRIERSYTKQEIITMYLNTVDFGSNAYGIQSAAKTFFNKKAKDLNVPEAAMLTGLLKAPSYYSPVLNPTKALQRRNTVIEQMEKYDYLTKLEAKEYKSTKIELQNYEVDNQNSGIATYFRSVAQNFLLDWCKKNNIDLYADGIKIYTTIDSRMQMHAEKALHDHMKVVQNNFSHHWAGRNPWADEEGKEIPNFIQNAAQKTERYSMLKEIYHDNKDSIHFYMNKRIKMKVFTWQGEKDTLMSPMDSLRYYKRFLQAGFLSMNPTNGHIKAWVGGLNHKFFKYDHVKQGKRQPGSTFKPFVYLAALDLGYSPCFEIQDVPVTFQYKNGSDIKTWTPQNSEGEYTGQTFTLRQALARSINSITANVMKRVSPEVVVEYCKKVGFISPLDPVPPLCLGSSDVSLFEMVGAYGTFANKGVYTEPFFITRIEDKNGKVIEEFAPNKKEALNEETAYLMLYMLKGGTEEKGGTALGLHRYPNLFGGNDVGGKTGTTSNYSDGWFMSVTNELVTGAWVGGDDRCIHFRSFEFGQGSKLALPIVGTYLGKVYGDQNIRLKKSYFKKPSTMSTEINCLKFKQPTDTLDIYNHHKSTHKIDDDF